MMRVRSPAASPRSAAVSDSGVTLDPLHDHTSGEATRYVGYPAAPPRMAWASHPGNPEPHAAFWTRPCWPAVRGEGRTRSSSPSCWSRCRPRTAAR